ncbi:MAG TPA: aminotransferase class IV [Bryobacteraceae bacterium]|nr:aminotransferase class IV [Bryobacteraceae bacterium]
MHRYLLHNERIREASEPLLLPGQVGFLNGWGVFSTLRVCDGILFAFDRHYRRMEHDAGLVHVPFEVAPDALQKLLLGLIEANQANNATLRVAVVRNRGGLFEAPRISHDADLVAFTADLTNWGDGVRLTYVPNGRFGPSPFAGVKVTSWAQNLTWYEQAHQRGFDEVILLNEAGQVSECTSANIFVIRENGVVWTPPLNTSGCLPGVTRAILLEEIQASGFAIAEHELSPSELEASDQVFITSTTRDLLPVLSVEDVPLRQDRRSLAVLQQAFSANRESYVGRHTKRQERLAV